MLRRLRSNRSRYSDRRKNWKLSTLEKRLMLAGDVGAAASPVDVSSSTAEVCNESPAQEDVQSQSSHLVIISGDVALDGQLLDAVPANAEIAVLDAHQDGVQQITELLASRHDLQSVHVLSHGSEARLQLGNATLSSETLEQYAPLISRWGKSVAKDGDILLYGCNVAEGEIGKQFVQRIGMLTGIDIAASTDRTASTAKNLGDWDLEWARGEIQYAGLLDGDVLHAFQGTLAISWGRIDTGGSSSTPVEDPDPTPPPPDPLPSNLLNLQDLYVSGSTGEKPQSKVWTYADQWWTVMPNDSGTWISRLDGNSWTPTLQVSSNTGVSADVKVSGDVAHILLLDGAYSQLASVEYVSSFNTYDFWSNGPGLVQMNLPGGIETATIDVDSTGRMWVAYDQSSSIEVRYSDGDYSSWSGPITIASGINSDDISVITALPNNTIGVLWSDQNSDRFGFRYHVDGDSPTAWSANEVPASQSALGIGGGMADDHLNVAVASDGTLYAAVKTSYDSSSQTKIGLLVRRPSGEWDNLYHVDSYGTRPIVLLNESAGRLLVAYTDSESGGDILYRESSTDQISFGGHNVLLSGSLNNVTSTKQNFTDDVVVLASGSGRASGVLFSFDNLVVNQAPQVVVGNDQTITLGNSAILSGSVGDDGLPNPPGALTTSWSVVSGPGSVAFGNAAAVNTTAEFSAVGTYVLQLTASDGQLSGSDQLTITVDPAVTNETPLSNQAPQVSAGNDRTIALGETALLSGFVNDDGLPDPPGDLTTTWSVVSGPGNVIFGNQSAANTTAQFSQSGTYVLRLTASDSELTSSDQVTIRVIDDSAPVTVVFQDGPDYQGTQDTKIYANNPSTNYGSASTLEIDGSPDIASLLRWDVSAIPVGSTVTSVTLELSITNTTSDTYEIYALQRAWDEQSATWEQAASGTPWSVAGATGSGDRDTTVLGQLSPSGTGTYLVTLNAAGLATVQSWVDSPSTNFGLIFEDYLNARNGADFASSEASNVSQRPKLTITYQAPEDSASVTNQPPQVSAGTNQTVTLGDSAVLAGAVVDDGLPNPPGSLVTNWSVVSGSGDVSFGDATAINTTAQFSDAGTYVLQLTVDDGELTSSDQITITVNPAVTNQAPQVLAGTDQNVTLGETAILTGTVTDDGLPNPSGALTTSWSLLSGPGTVSFGDATAVNTTAQFSTVGTYLLQLSASDGQLSSADQVVITVDAQITNQSPQVWAGNDQTIALGETATLTGLVSDDGLPNPPATLTTNWSAVSGPGFVSFGNSAAPNTLVQFSAAGTYVLQLTVTDGELSNADQVTITVNPVIINQAPQVDAGSDQFISLDETAALSGLVSDDGLPTTPGTLTSNWAVISGPGYVSFGNSAAPNTTAQFSAAGTYVLQLTATDGQLSNADQVTITVNPVIINQAPQVDAGSDQFITLGETATLSGLVSDDGLPTTPGTLTSNWTVISGPGYVNFDNSAAPNTTAQFSAAGTYVLQLTVSDGQISSSDQVTLTVNTADQSGLVGNWTLDGFTNGSVSDASGFGNDGTVQGNPQIVSGPTGDALQFNGNSDYLLIEDSPSLDITDQITISAWIRPDQNGTQYLVKKASHNQVDGFELSLSSSGTVFVRFNQASDGNAHRLDSVTNYPTNGDTWMHVVATYDGSTIKIYINGELDSSKDDQFDIATNDLGLGIGAEYDGYRSLSGAMDSVQLYNRALTDEEIMALYLDGFSA